MAVGEFDPDKYKAAMNRLRWPARRDALPGDDHEVLVRVVRNQLSASRPGHSAESDTVLAMHLIALIQHTTAGLTPERERLA